MANIFEKLFFHSKSIVDVSMHDMKENGFNSELAESIRSTADEDSEILEEQNANTENAYAEINESDNEFDYDAWCETLEYDDSEDEIRIYFENYNLLDQNSVQAEFEFASLTDETYLMILEQMKIYRFLKEEPKIQKLFRQVYEYCYEDFLGFDDGEGTGRAANEATTNKNIFSLSMTIAKNVWSQYVVTLTFETNPYDEY